MGGLAERIREEWENERAQRCLEGISGAIKEMERETGERCIGEYGCAVGLQLRRLYHNAVEGDLGSIKV